MNFISEENHNKVKMIAMDLELRNVQLEQQLEKSQEEIAHLASMLNLALTELRKAGVNPEDIANG